MKNSISKEDKTILVFILTAAMQTAFLGSATVKQLLGYDLSKTEGRAAYISKLVDILFERDEKL